MLKKFLPILLVLFLVPAVFASTLTLTPVVDQISPYDFARFTLTINNTAPADKFTISYSDLDWIVETEPLTDYTTGIFVGAGQVYSTTLLAKPVKDIDSVFRKHNIEIKVKSQNTGEELSSIISVDVRRDLIRYPFATNIDLILPENIFPIKANSIKVRLENTNMLNITGLEITLNSSLFEKKTTVDLGPKSEKIIDFSVTLDKLVPPQKDNATLTVTHGNETVRVITKEYSVASYGKFLSQTSTLDKFLGEEKTVVFANNGNSKQTETIFIEAGSGFKRLFSSTEPGAKVAYINNVAYYTADLTLDSEASAAFVVKTSYLPLVFIIIILIVACILYFVYRNPIIVAKEAREVGIEEGGIAKLSVLIKMKNRSAKSIKNVRIIERIPNIAKVQIKESETLRPTKTYNYQDGMAMEYHIGKMEADEVRFISYHLKTKLAVIGGIRLKPVIVEYEAGKRAYSNPVEVYTP